MAKNRETIRKRIATRRRNAAKRARMRRNSPDGRLNADGASKPRQIERRLLWVAKEWLLPRAPRVGRNACPALFTYCQTHGVSLDWMLEGDLKGLQRMMQTRRAGKAAPTPESLKAKIARLSESEREAVCKVMDQFLEQS